jgi:hypothetical protein
LRREGVSVKIHSADPSIPLSFDLPNQ